MKMTQVIDPPEWIKIVLGWIAGALASLIGGWGVQLQLLLYANVFNHVFGIAAAIKTGEGFDSKKLTKGMGILACYWLGVMVMNNIDLWLASINQKPPVSVRDVYVAGLFLADTASTLANMRICGVPIPKQITDNIAKLQNLPSEIGKAIT